MLPSAAMDLQAIAGQKADAWQKSASATSARMRSPEGFCTVQLTDADAAIMQVRTVARAFERAAPVSVKHLQAR